MVCFTAFMVVLWSRTENKKTETIWFAIQWILNVSWNFIFFERQLVQLGLAEITLLTGLMGAWFIRTLRVQKGYSSLLLPYLLWLVVATSLNAYIALNN